MIKVRLSILFFSLVLICNTHATVLPDSLMLKIKAAKDTAKYYAIRKAMFYFVKQSDYTNAEKYAQWMMQYADSIKYERGIAIAATSLGIASKNLGNYTKAAEYYMLAYKSHEKAKNYYGMATAYMNLGNLYLSMKEYDKALYYQRMVLSTYNYEDDSLTLGLAYSNLGIAYNALYINDSAEYCYKKSLAIRETLHDSDGIAGCINNIGILFLDAKKYYEALQYFSKYIDITLKQNYVDQIAIGYVNRSETYLHMNNYSKATADISAALFYAINAGVPDLLMDVYEMQSKIYEQSGNYQQALLCAEKYRQIKDSILNQSSAKAISEMQTKFDTEKKELEISLLTQEKNINQLSIEDQESKISKQYIMLLSVSLSILLLLVLIIAGIKQIRRKRNDNKTLENANHIIEAQKNILEEKQQLIIDSVEYAKTIQQALMSSPASNCFKLYSDDSDELIQSYFYKTYTTVKQQFCFLVASATHGVPGALTSVYVSNILNNYTLSGITPGKVPFILLSVKEYLNKHLPTVFNEIMMIVISANSDNNTAEAYSIDPNIKIRFNDKSLSSLKMEIKTAGKSNSIDRFVFDNAKAGKITILNSADSISINVVIGTPDSSVTT